VPERLEASWEADRRLTVVETKLLMHLEQCDKRWATIAKLLWYVATVATGALLTLAGTVAKLTLHL
jgi:hypothetical protein